MKRTIVVLASCIAAAFIIANCSGGLTTSSGKTLVSINGKKITEGDLDFLGTINPRIAAQLSSPAGKKRILDNLVEQELLYQEAVKKGINRDPEVRAKAELYRRVIVAQSLLDKEMETAAKKYYDEHKGEFQKLGLAQIMIRYENNPKKVKKIKGQKIHSEKEALTLANKALERINKGEAFAKVAEDVSEDVATKNRGGDMGLVTKNDQRFVARGYGPLVDKAFEMKVGEVAGPIKTENGYHIITVIKGTELEPFADAERSIMFKMRSKIRTDLVEGLKKKGSVTFTAELEPKTMPPPPKPAKIEKPKEELSETVKIEEKPGAEKIKIEEKKDITVEKEKKK